MAASKITCPHCLYEASLTWFENVDNRMLRCRRCRSRFEDPDAYSADISYADWDGRQVLYRYPFPLGAENAMIRVRDGYRALIVSDDGHRLWLKGRNNPVASTANGFQLYYICLSPRILWGTRTSGSFGVHGSAQLSVTSEYIESFCGMDGQIMLLEDHLKTLVSRHMTEFVRRETARHNTAVLEYRDSYLNALGVVADGVSLVRIEPLGYRTENGHIGQFPQVSGPVKPVREAEGAVSYPRAPVEFFNPPKNPYVIPDGREEVYIKRKKNGLYGERHKAGETIDREKLQGAEKLLRFPEKEFDLPFGWGVYNQTSALSGYFSANGTVSFFIDSTERLGLLFSGTESWRDFEEQFFVNIFRQEVSDALRKVLNRYAGRQGFNPARINQYLSAMSIELSNILNGEDSAGDSPAFRSSGLRVKRIDILNLSLYPVWR